MFCIGNSLLLHMDSIQNAIVSILDIFFKIDNQNYNRPKYLIRKQLRQRKTIITRWHDVCFSYFGP
jgi:hypothetical protein